MTSRVHDPGSGHNWLSGCDGSGLGVDLACVDFFVESFGHCLVEPRQQLGEGLAVAATEHGQ